jgi:hypothetical protein
MCCHTYQPFVSPFAAQETIVKSSHRTITFVFWLSIKLEHVITRGDSRRYNYNTLILDHVPAAHPWNHEISVHPTHWSCTTKDFVSIFYVYFLFGILSASRMPWSCRTQGGSKKSLEREHIASRSERARERERFAAPISVTANYYQSLYLSPSHKLI